MTTTTKTTVTAHKNPGVGYHAEIRIDGELVCSCIHAHRNESAAVRCGEKLAAKGRRGQVSR